MTRYSWMLKTLQKMLEINEMHPRKKSTRKMKNGVPKTWFLVLIFKNVIVFTPRTVVIYDVYKKNGTIWSWIRFQTWAEIIKVFSLLMDDGFDLRPTFVSRGEGQWNRVERNRKRGRPFSRRLPRSIRIPIWSDPLSSVVLPLLLRVPRSFYFFFSFKEAIFVSWRTAFTIRMRGFLYPQLVPALTALGNVNTLILFQKSRQETRKTRNEQN